MNRAEVVIKARKLMKLSQSRLAEGLGVSPKAIQSYEQGWRIVPSRFINQLLVMLSEFMKPTLAMEPCLIQESCELEIQLTLTSRQPGTSCSCWMWAANCCLTKSDENNPIADFVSCPVVARLLDHPS